jgi:hypothetical protein
MERMSPNIKAKPWPPNSPVVTTWPVPTLKDQIRPRPIIRTPIIVVVDIPEGRPDVPVVIIDTMGYRNSVWFLLEILDLNIFHIKAISPLSHNMDFQLTVFHMPSRWNINGFRGLARSKNKGVPIRRRLLF